MDWKEFQLDKEWDASNIPSLYRVDYARCGISNGVNEIFVAIDQSSKLDVGSIIRCENKVNVWYVDGCWWHQRAKMIALPALRICQNISDAVPCFFGKRKPPCLWLAYSNEASIHKETRFLVLVLCLCRLVLLNSRVCRPGSIDLFIIFIRIRVATCWDKRLDRSSLWSYGQYRGRSGLETMDAGRWVTPTTRERSLLEWRLKSSASHPIHRRHNRQVYAQQGLPL
jgi:hypothetical protein